MVNNYRYALYVLFSLLFAGIFYISTTNIILTIVVALLYFLFFFIIYSKKEKRFNKKIKRTYEAISFINNFIISLSVTNSIQATYEAIKQNVSDELRQQMDAIEHLNVEQKIIHLNKYFDLPIYNVFINLIKQYVEIGTNILESSSILIHDTRNLENRVHEYELLSKRKEKDFLVSWGFTFLIIVVLKIALASFLSNNKIDLSFYPILIFLYFVIFLLIYYLFTLKLYDSSFIYKGETEIEEKRIERKSRKAKFRFKKRKNSN